ncbi:hypothetical protein C4569_02070 [Candidatus Parcubacteria bacterium]|nr:MAG: hypothetical protein C4569_02070 [Candidatus Parcubacteria bacterium]
MKKIFYLTIITVLLIITGCAKKGTVLNGAGLKQEVPKIFQPVSDYKNGVDLTVENIRKENGNTILELSLNNHQYDLSQMDAVSRTTLKGIRPADYKVINSGSGHHVQSEIIFPGDLSGELIFGLGDELTFKLNI